MRAFGATDGGRRTPRPARPDERRAAVLVPPVPVGDDSAATGAELQALLDAGLPGGRIDGPSGVAAAAALLVHHSQAEALAVDAAGSLDELRPVAARIESSLALLRDGGLAVDRIARIAGGLNRQLHARLWSLLAPPRLAAESCLLVMGSEGRGEQIARTDQDNALLLRDGCDAAWLQAAEAAARRFNDALAELGWPPCTGGVMADNPLWRRPLANFRESLADWVHGHEAEGVLRLAIFVDAQTVAGDAALLAAGARAARPPDGRQRRLLRPLRRRRRPLPRTRQLVGAADRPCRRAAARPEEDRHLPDRPRRARAGAAVRRPRHRHRRSGHGSWPRRAGSTARSPATRSTRCAC